VCVCVYIYTHTHTHIHTYIILLDVLYGFEMLREEEIEGFPKPKSFCTRGEVSAYWKKIVNFVILPFTKYLDEKIMDDMGRARRTHGTDEKPKQNTGRPKVT